MESPRKIAEIIKPRHVREGAGVFLKRAFPARDRDHLDPFLLFDHFGSNDPRDYLAGFPMHPHRGIETVTYVLKGHLDHKDSLGNAGSIEAGDVQWMTAGGGIMHEEMPKPLNGHMEGFQLWVNLPAKYKMTTPRFQEISSLRIPELRLDNGVRIRVIAGSVRGTRGPVSEVVADPTVLDVSLPPYESFFQPLTREHTAFAYVFEGEGTFGPNENEPLVSAPHLLVFGEGDGLEAWAGDRGVRFLLVSGRPIGEPIVRHGPFVMNTPEEIYQALEDLKNGTFVRDEFRIQSFR
ncbi:MAG: pirin family protein [Planctomycetota bacterium]|jgi:redox-sensitive bicupin YhaK (pirin superfamily)